MQPVSLDCHQHMIEIQDLSFSYGEQKVISNLNYTVKNVISSVSSVLTVRARLRCLK